MKGLNSTDGDLNRRDDENCKNPAEQMIRITVSVYMRKKNKGKLNLLVLAAAREV